MRFLLTGAGGQVGREVVRWAGRRGLSVRALERAELDVSDAGQVRDAIASTDGLTAVLNTAAYTEVDRAESEPERAYLVNARGAEVLAEVAGSVGVPLVHVSTDYVFDGDRDTTYREDEEPHPLNVYGESKLAGERAVRDALARHVIIRTSWIFSAHRRNFVKTMLWLAEERDELSIVCDEEGCPTGAGQLAHTLLTIGRMVSTPSFEAWGTYHYAGRPSITRSDYARAIFSASGGTPGLPTARVLDIGSDEYESAARRPRRAILDCRRIQSELGIHPPEWRPYLSVVLRQISKDRTT
ncbi:MAG: dTDP-4-dehydrorhamnose reductase [Candidatus Palauibacterales bacterium]|nr:dTDP-4-dehydrorhamnose reductase [Candidatus Palauibacterales bacterium]MDP2582455.1 dTDP-4-dehydrorhamnose reductase [Candidatus Palauibacterales bacterium]